MKLNPYRRRPIDETYKGGNYVKWFKSCLFLCSLLFAVGLTLAQDSASAANAGWSFEEGKWYYYLEDGTRATGWMQENSKWYFFDNSGVMQTGWLDMHNNRYYLQSNGAMLKGLKHIEGRWYHFDSKHGYLKDGQWEYNNGNWYYVLKNGSNATGWIFDIDTQQRYYKWYFLNDSGHIHKGWLFWNNQWFYFNDQGHMEMNWEYIDGKWYYFDLTSGYMKTGHLTIDGNYYMTESGAMHTGWLLKMDHSGGYWSFYDKGGKKQYGWKKIEGDWYYLSTHYGKMQVGWQWIGDKWYYFHPDGKMAHSVNIDGYQLGKDGSLQR